MMATYFMMISGMTMLTMTQKHALTLLISIEFSLLASLLILTMNITTHSTSPFIILTFLTLIASESTLGLSIIISMTRFKGNDQINTTSMTKL